MAGEDGDGVVCAARYIHVSTQPGVFHFSRLSLSLLPSPPFFSRTHLSLAIIYVLFAAKKNSMQTV